MVTRPAAMLRPYQIHALDGGDPLRGPGVIRCFARHERVLCVLATGLGKTQIALEVMRRYHARHGRRALILSHREELVTQPIARGTSLGMEFGREQAEHRAGQEPYVSATVQTLAARLGRFPRDDFGLVVVDEAHHAASGGQYAQVLDHFAGCWVLGLTATPHRLDGLSLRDAGFTAVGYEFSLGRDPRRPDLEDPIALGWLVPIRWRRLVISGLDLSALRVRGGDFDPESLAVLMAEHAHSIAQHVVEHVGRRQTMIFCVNVAHAHAQAAALRRHTSAGVEVVDGSTDPEHRRRIVAAYSTGELQYLVNCGVFTEGFDAPATACVVMARPTRSVALALQCIGRGTRPLPGVVDTPQLHAGPPNLRRAAIACSAKPDLLLLDIAGVGDDLALGVVADALGGGLTVEERAQLLRLGADGEQTFDTMLSDALRLAAVEEARKMRLAKTSASVVDSDPFAATNVLSLKEKDDPRAPRASRELVTWLRKHGVQHPERLSEEAAAKAKKTICVRYAKGLSSYREMQTLQRFGVPVARTVAMRRETAAELIRQINDNGGRRPAAWDSDPKLGGRVEPPSPAPASW